ncbi:MAG: hypothetical protein JJT85_02905 [Chromatiales bacterium]|nr:hypothetical protein [Chromatiales bacterium]
MRRILLLAASVLVIVAAGILAYFYGALPRQRPAPEFVINYTPELVARGDYLVNEVLLCLDCHSERDWTRYSGPPVPPLGAGRSCIDKDSKAVGINFGSGGFPGLMCIPNITPDDATGIGAWTDGEVARAIREGIGRNGQALFPIMPWFMYQVMTDEDLAAVIAYLRSMPAVYNDTPATELDFPLNLLNRLYPRPLDGPVPAVDRNDAVAYGEYLSKIARCEFCHTPRIRRSIDPVPGRFMAGGVPFFMGQDMHYSKNLTPHEDGMGLWTREMFIARFKMHTEPFPLTREEDNSEMNWVGFSGMTEEDLSAIWDYLQTLPPKELVLLDRAD